MNPHAAKHEMSLHSIDHARIDRVFALQRHSRWVAKASTASERLAKLERLKQSLLAHATAVNKALWTDLARPPEQPASLEVGVLLADLEHTIANLRHWMARVRVTPAPLLPLPEVSGAEMFIQYESRGIILIFGAWNQPFMLSLQPLIAAVAAGNVAIVKPNELTPASSKLIATIIRDAFQEQDVAVFEGGVDLADALLDLTVDHIFFTGSPAVGRKVAAAAARNLASTTLELGGKSPAIIDGTVDLKTTAAIIAAGKLYNAGQVCISFDHVWVKAEYREEFVRHYTDWITAGLYQDGALRPNTLTHMVNRSNFDRVAAYIAQSDAGNETFVGSGRRDSDTLTIEPAVVVNVTPSSDVMQEEIFGPILPVIDYTSLDEVVAYLQSNEKPLALYAFTRDHDTIDRLLRETSSGGVTVNAWATHAFESSLPFGGIGNSGSGSYRGEFGFRALSHARSVVVMPEPFDSVSAMNN